MIMQCPESTLDIIFRHAVEVGERQGSKLGEYIFNNNLREFKKAL